MSEQDILIMRREEVRRLKIIQEVIKGQINQVKAALMLNVSDRQMRRLVARVRQEGDRGVIHKSRGRPSNRKINERIKQRVLHLYEKRYEGFGATLFSEKLLEREKIKFSDETLRRWLMEAGLWQCHRKNRPHRQWRARKECFGEMIQMDGSHHDWLEGRGPQLVLMAYIDDATNEAYGRFYDYEGTLPAMDSFKRYIQRYGLPISVYLDRHSTYKSTKKLPDDMEESEPLSQFGRALKELGVEVIHAYSPQAKGRIERLFGVLQDRLVKEMRLAGITTKDGANEFLESYWPRHNKRFGRYAANPSDVHVRPVHCNLDRYLCIKTERVVAKDYTIAHRGKVYQLHTRKPLKRIEAHEHCDGSLHIIGKNESIRYTEVANPPMKFPEFYHQPSGWW
ncbi:ISNCY family transposase [bacterium]|nr:ISNCY family transposase [bacterium]